MRVTIPCPYEGAELPVNLTFEGDPPIFTLNLTAAFVEHMNTKHDATFSPVDP